MIKPKSILISKSTRVQIYLTQLIVRYIVKTISLLLNQEKDCMWKFLICIKICLVLSVISFLYPLSIQADENSYIIVHVHNPEGIEIGMIPGIGQTGVVIYDGDNSIGCGAYDAKTLNKPLSISSGTHNIKVRFNGITKEQSVSVDSGETKDVIFTLERINYIDEIKNKLLMNFSDTVSVSGWTDKAGRVWKETELCAVGGDFWVSYCSADVSITVQAIITHLEDNRFCMEHHILGGASSVWNIHPPPNAEWSVGAYGFVVINQKNAVALPSTCDIWFVQGWGIMPTLGGIYLHDKPSNYLNPPGEQGSSGPICSYAADVTGQDNYLFGLLPGAYTISGGFRQPAGTYSMSLTTDFNSTEDIELASSVSDVPYYLGLYVEAQADKQIYSPADEAKIYCTVKEGFTGLPINPDTITAVVTKPDGSKETVLLSEIATGSYAGNFDKTSSLGHYQVMISAKKAGLPDGEFKLDFLVGMLEVLDGSDFSDGKELYSDQGKLSWGGAAVEGAAVDGVTRLLLRIKLGSEDQLQFSIAEGSSSEENGFLRSLDGSGQAGDNITVSTVSLDDGIYAFAVYQVPDNFVRNSYPEDKWLAERTITFNVTSTRTSSQLCFKPIKLVRPPVILVHGLWSNPKMWIVPYNFADALWSRFPGIKLVFANYLSTNADSFETNKYLIPWYVKKTRIDFRQRKIAMVRADIIGHSMGGVLAHIYAEGGQGWYKRADNFFVGDINRLITLNSPHKGSFVADLIVKFISDETMPLGVRGEFMELLDTTGRPVDKGAVFDLMTTSDQIEMLNRRPAFASCHAIGDDVVVPGTADIDAFLLDWIASTVNEGLPDWLGVILEVLGSRLDPYKNQYLKNVVDDHSDLVVSLDSQLGGIGWGSAASSILDGWHNTINDATVKEVTNLLNANPDTTSSPFFAPGFPLE